MNILYIAYSCSPYHGSEDAIGWNIPLQCANFGNEVFVITKEEQRTYVDKYFEDHDIPNLHFYYVDIPTVYKKIFKGPLYSGRLNIWHKQAFTIAAQLCEEYDVDVIHQITPIEFRSIGDYGKIPNVKFVCGPIAGGQTIPRGLWSYCFSYAHVEILRLTLNCIYRAGLRFNKKLVNCNHLLFANVETRNFLADKISLSTKCSLMTDVSIKNDTFVDERRIVNNDKVRFVVVGRLVKIKGHDLLLDALKQIPNDMEYECCIVGEGPEKQRLVRKCKRYNLDNRVKFIGEVNYTEISEIYNKSDVLLFPSFREATGTVILEAMSMGQPVITMNRFGGAMILDEQCGWLYDGDSREAFVCGLVKAMLACIRAPEEVRRRGENARKRAAEFSWERKMEIYQRIYNSLL